MIDVLTYRRKDGSREVVVSFDDYPDEHSNPLQFDTWLRFITLANTSYEWGTEQVSQSDLNVIYEESTKRGPDKVLVLPVYAYVHSGVAFSLGREYPFNCPWDSGQAGFLVIDRKEFTELTGREWQDAQQVAGEVLAQYQLWINGEVICYRKFDLKTCSLGHEHREEIDACFGFLGQDAGENGLLSAAGIADPEDSTELHSAWEEVD